MLRAPLALPPPEQIETPAGFKAMLPSIADHLATYRVFPEPQPAGGLMTTYIDFEDAPDCEVITGGVHLRHPHSPVVARHGAFVMWGFAGPPDRMTETGRRLLLNVIAYAHAHRGEKPVVRMVARAREYSPFLEVERPFVHSPGDSLAIDETARRLGVANDSAAFLRMLAERLDTDPKDADAATLLKRYCPDAPATGFGEWLAAHEGDLFFSDWGGYRWFSRREVLRLSREAAHVVR